MCNIYSLVMEQTAWCVKCRSKKEIKNGVVKSSKKGNKYIQSNCESCNTKINRFLKKDNKLNEDN